MADTVRSSQPKLKLEIFILVFLHFCNICIFSLYFCTSVFLYYSHFLFLHLPLLSCFLNQRRNLESKENVKPREEEKQNKATKSFCWTQSLFDQSFLCFTLSCSYERDTQCQQDNVQRLDGQKVEISELDISQGNLFFWKTCLQAVFLLKSHKSATF